MRGGIDALGQATDDAKAGSPQVSRKLECIASARLGRVAAADDRQRWHVQQARVAF